MPRFKLYVVWIVALRLLSNSSQGCSTGLYPCIVNATNGHITTPEYPSHYPSNANLSWLIHVQSGYSIKLEFDSSFGIELRPDCQSDYLAVYDGSTTVSPLIGKYCGLDKPANLYSYGPMLLLNFISDSKDQSLGFYANYTALKTASNCSARQTDEENTNVILKGIPGYLAYFENHDHKRPARCLWRLRAPWGFGIKITIYSLDFLENITCLKSNFEIYKGYIIQESRLIHRYCRIVTDSPVIKYVPERTITIRLNRDELSSWSASNGLSVRYQFIKKEKNKCSTLNSEQENRNVNLSGHNGNFTIHTDSGIPNQNIKQCIWKIKAPKDYQIRLDFVNFTLNNDCGKSYVEIFDGESSKGKFCGPAAPWVMFSTGGFLVVKFIASGNLNVSMGFIGVYEVVTNATGRCSTINTKEMNSNIQLKDQSGVIMTPNYPSKYPSNYKCIWIINVPSQYRIRLHFVAFNVEDHGCEYDFVEIRDGNNSTSPLKTGGKLCGDDVPYDVYSTSNRLRIMFQSDETEQMPGFQAFYSVVRPEPGKCSPMNTVQENNNIYIKDVPGLLTSPNYPQPYPPNIKCTWRIMVPRSSRIHIHFHYFKVHPSCGEEFLEGFDGTCYCNGSLGLYCGSRLPFDMFSTGHSMTLVFQSSKFASYPGFKLSYSVLKLGPGICSKVNPPSINDNLVMNRSEGFINSPNYPMPYTYGMQCTWRARAPTGYHVEIKFTALDFPLPCEQDYVEVRDGDSPYSNLKGYFCNLRSASRIYSSGRELWLRFVSRRTKSGAYKGFSLNYRMIKAGNCSKDFDLSWNTNLNFGQSMSGILTSPGYPSPYPRDIQCSWKITVPFGYRVLMKFYYIYIREPCQSDYVEVKDGFYSFSKTLGKFCKTKEYPFKVVSTGRRMLVHFQSGKWSRSGMGFEGYFWAISSGKTSSNSFSSEAITVSMIVVAGFVLITLAFIFIYWILKKRYRRRSSSRPRDHDLAVIPPMPVPPLDDIPDCLIAEDRPPSYAEAVNENDEGQPPEREDEPIDSVSTIGTSEGRDTIEDRRGLDNEGFAIDPPPYESLYGVDSA